jgi:membrane protease YdiL (CAAX protease family)
MSAPTLSAALALNICEFEATSRRTNRIVWLIWPILWGFAEQLLYLGYVFPRLERSNGKLLAAGVVVAFWSLQHTALPFVPDATYLAYRTLTALPVAVTAVLLYLFVTRRRLLPLVIVHCIADALAAVRPASAARPSGWPGSRYISSPTPRMRSPLMAGIRQPAGGPAGLAGQGSRPPGDARTLASHLARLPG